MDIYSIGTEKCIDGVWGREVNGRFYTHYFEQYGNTTLYRRLDIDNTNWFAIRNGGAVDLEFVSCTTITRLKEYTPKHSKDLENLKRGDVVQVKVGTIGKNVAWGSTLFLNKVGEWFITGSFFDSNGNINQLHTSSHKEVYLKPPFDI